MARSGRIEAPGARVSRGRTQRGRERAARELRRIPPGRPLLRAVDHGKPVWLEAAAIGAAGDRWVEPFLEANRTHLRRLGVKAEVAARRGLAVRLTPGSRIGTVPLLSPATRRVTAGLLVSPRFRWSALGAVLGETGFATEPALGGSPLVPGSAREVPAWLLAAPVIRRLEALLRHGKRGFTKRFELRQSPRGRVDWSLWARTHLPSGRWTSLPCHFSEPDDDPHLMAAVRWTLGRLDDELALHEEALSARLLRARLADLRVRVRPGEAQRPSAEPMRGSEWIVEATQGDGLGGRGAGARRGSIVPRHELGPGGGRGLGGLGGCLRGRARAPLRHGGP